jgi:two-component system sensor histidine kinase/response regulator
MPPLQPLRILLVEDNVINQKVASLMLKKKGHVVVTVNNGREAIETLADQDFDAVLMDVQMPEMDGLQATAAIRAGEEGTDRHLPILAVTAHALNGDREDCLGAGMDGYLAKPIQSAQLLQALAEVLSLARQTPDSRVRSPGALSQSP